LTSLLYRTYKIVWVNTPFQKFKNKAMKKNIFPPLFIILISCTLFVAFVSVDKSSSVNMPYKKSGLTQAQAAQYLLSKFTFGAKPGEVESVVNTGLDKWFSKQLAANFEEDSLPNMLSNFDALNKSTEQLANLYPNPGAIANIARRKYDLEKKDSNTSKRDYKEEIRQMMVQEGFKSVAELNKQLIFQKVFRATYSNNQLQEVLTDFWFNHFNVSLTKPQCVQYVLPYERDAIRPFVTGNFLDMLLATAKHPAMLEYLDNASSVSTNNNQYEKQINTAFAKQMKEGLEKRANDTNNANAKLLQRLMNNKKMQGLNENYAREVMELHTLGVDGGYTQNDVTQLARILTGWSVFPMSKYSPGRELIDRIGRDKLKERGFIYENGFFYKPDKHDDKEKFFLGKTFAAGGGYNEGVEALTMLANHPSTSNFIAKKIAVRFVGDNPSNALVSKMAEAFTKSSGNIKTVLLTMVNSTEFWQAAKGNDKVKSPFELAISSIRATNSNITDAFQLFNWCTKMGQRVYYYQAPTGFPDRASFWINTGSILNRMNFGLAFATGKIPGIKLNLSALNNHHEPESIADALAVYSKILLPEKNNEKNIERLTQLLSDENFAKKISEAAEKNNTQSMALNTGNTMESNEGMMMQKDQKKLNNKAQKQALGKKNNTTLDVAYSIGNNSMVGQVVGVILGSPEFQKKS
jgi:uncharacterized protein (DUF1800 family)